MQIGNVSNIAPSTLEYSGSQRPSKPATPSSAADVTQSTRATFANSTSTAEAASSLSRVQSNLLADHMEKLAASYSTTVEGKDYGGTVEESAGTYTASVPIPPGARASGSTIQAAENNLNIILDTLA